MSKNRAFSIAYRSSIGRPSFYDLNPFIIKQNDYMYSIGNPELTAQYNDNFYADYTFGSHAVSAYTELTSKMIHNTYYKRQGIIYHQALNYGNAEGYGLNHGYHANIKPWLYLSINSGVFYNRFKPIGISAIAGFAAYNNLFAHVKLFKSWAFEINSNYQTPSKYRNVDVSHRYCFDSGLQKTFLDGKITSKIKVLDLFNTVRDKNTAHYQRFLVDSYKKTRSRAFMFFIQFHIDNKKKIKELKTESDNDNRNRL